MDILIEAAIEAAGEVISAGIDTVIAARKNRKDNQEEK